VSSKKRQSKKQDFVSIGERKESFIGDECIKLLACHDRLLEHVRASPTVCQADHDKAAKAWELYVDLWKLLVEPIQFPQTKELPPLLTRQKRAREV
jgi:hypothetical protein